METEEKRLEALDSILSHEDVTPYIKPTRYVHESGFRCFEIGYCRLNQDNRVEEKVIVGTGSDHIFTDLLERNPMSINMDLTRDGYIRIFNHTKKLRWGTALSSVELLDGGSIKLL